MRITWQATARTGKRRSRPSLAGRVVVAARQARSGQTRHGQLARMIDGEGKGDLLLGTGGQREFPDQDVQIVLPVWLRIERIDRHLDLLVLRQGNVVHDGEL